MKPNIFKKSLSIKEKIQYYTAIIFLCTGEIMCFLSFFLNKYDIENGVLFYLGTTVTFCGAVFGLDIIIKNNVIEAESRILEHVDKRIDNTIKEDEQC